MALQLFFRIAELLRHLARETLFARSSVWTPEAPGSAEWLLLMKRLHGGVSLGSGARKPAAEADGSACLPRTSAGHQTLDTLLFLCQRCGDKLTQRLFFKRKLLPHIGERLPQKPSACVPFRKSCAACSNPQVPAHQAGQLRETKQAPPMRLFLAAGMRKSVYIKESAPRQAGRMFRIRSWYHSSVFSVPHVSQ